MDKTYVLDKSRPRDIHEKEDNDVYRMLMVTRRRREVDSERSTIYLPLNVYYTVGRM